MRYIHIIHFLVSGLVLLTLASCGVTSSSPGETVPLVLDLTLEPKISRSIDDVYVEVVLTNQSDERVLVHRRLFCLPSYAPVEMAEMIVVVSDSSGDPLDPRYNLPKYEWPSEATLAVLRPGEQDKIKISLHRFGYYADMFKKGRKYTVVAFYQNQIDVTKNFIEGPVSAFVGIVPSNEESFVILP